MVKNVAILISGHLRKYESYVSSFINCIVKPLEEKGWSVDIFISTWDKRGFWTPDDKKGVDNGETVTNETIDNDLYSGRIRVKEVEPFEGKQEEFIRMADDILGDPPHRLKFGRKQNIVGMFYKMNRVFEMMKKYSVENKKKYDLVIRSRPDLLFSSKVDFFALVKLEKLNLFEAAVKYPDDTFFMGPIDVMETIFTCSIKDVYREEVKMFDPHSLFEGILGRNKISENKVGLPRDGILVKNNAKGEYCDH